MDKRIGSFLHACHACIAMCSCSKNMCEDPTTADFLPILPCAEHRSRLNITHLPCAIISARIMLCVGSGLGTAGIYIYILLVHFPMSNHCRIVFFICVDSSFPAWTATSMYSVEDLQRSATGSNFQIAAQHLRSAMFA